MGWNTPATWSVNEQVTASKMTQQIYDNMTWLGAPPRAALSGTLTIPSGSTFVTPSSGSWSGKAAGGLYVGSTSYYLQAPVAGVYIVTATAIFSTSATGKRGIALSSSAAGGGTIHAEAQTEPVQNTEVTALSVAAVVDLAAFANVHIGIRQSTGSNMSVGVRFGGVWQGTAGSTV